jgi:hypothetical protein
VGLLLAVRIFPAQYKVMRILRQPSAIQFMMDQKQPENVEYFSPLASMIMNGARYTHEIKSRIAMA